MRRIFSLALIFFVLFPGSALADQTGILQGLDKVKLQLKWTHQFQFAGYYAALEQGYYRDAGLDVELLERKPGQPRAVDTLLAGAATFAIEGPNVLVSRLQGAPVVALAAIFQHSPSVAIALQKSQITTAKGMVGKRFMTYGDTEFEIPAMTMQEGIAPESITWLPTSFSVNSLVKGETDLYSCYLTNEPFLLEQQNIPYSIINPVNYGIDFYGDILFTTEEEIHEHPLRVKAFRAASLKGWQYALAHPIETVELILSKYAPQKSREHLLFEAYESARLIQPDVVEIGHINPGRFSHMAEVMKKLGKVADVGRLNGFTYTEKLSALSEAEQAWLAKHKTVRVRVGNSPPLIYDDGKTPPHGLLIDYLEKLTQTYGIDIEYVRRPWSEALAEIGTLRGPDVMPALRPSPERSQQLALSQPYVNLHSVIFTRANTGFIGGIEDLAGRKVGIQKGVLAAKLLKNRYPLVNAVEVDDDFAGLKALMSGQLDAYIGNLLMVGEIIAEQGLVNLKVAAPFPLLKPEHVLGVRKDWPELVSLFDRVVSGMTPEEQTEIRSRWLSVRYEHGISRDQLWKWGLWVLAAVSIGSGLFLLWTTRLKQEIKRRKKIEEALTRSVWQYQQLVQVIPHGVVELDLDLRVAYCNHSLARMLGYSAEELHGKPLNELIVGAPLEPEMFVNPHRKAAPLTLQVQLRGSEQRLFDVRFDFNMGEARVAGNQVVIVTDMTQQQQTEEALLQSEAFYRNTFEHIQAGVIHVAGDGRITRVNRYMSEMLGYSAQEFLNLDMPGLTYAEDLPLSSEVLQKLKTGGGSYSLAKRYVKKTGEPVWGLVTVTVQPQMDGSAGYVVVVQNIDEFKQQQDEVAEKALNLEAIIEQRTAELHQRISEVEALNSAMVNLADDLFVTNQKLEEKRLEVDASNSELEAFAYSVSHDLRAPLRHAAGFASILQERAAASLDDASRQYLHKIIEAAEKMGKMIDDLLTFSRAGRADLMMTPVDMNLLFGEVRAEIDERYQVPKVAWQIAELPMVRGDLGALRQVVINLLDNAAKYSAKCETPCIEVLTSHKDGAFVFKICDNGVGFDQAYSDKLFQVFQRLHQEKDYSGTGIGLASVKRIVERHGGWVSAEANPGQGACFSFALPDGSGEGR